MTSRDYKKLSFNQLMKLRKELDSKSARLRIENAYVEAELMAVCRALVHKPLPKKVKKND